MIGAQGGDVAWEVGVSQHTIYDWKAKYGEMDVGEAQEAKQLRENTRLKKLVVDPSRLNNSSDLGFCSHVGPSS